MTLDPLQARRDLKRLLANGLLTAVPKRPADQALLLAMAAAHLPAGRELAEPEVNAALKAWLEGISAPFGIDHVTLRRMLVDARYLVRSRSGSTYRVEAARAAEIGEARELDPARVLDEIRDERGQRKQQHAG